jgi:AraC-like DNA-binding protein
MKLLLFSIVEATSIMKFSGHTEEYIELATLETPTCTIFKEPYENSLTVLWFETNDNEFIIDGVNHRFSINQIVFLTEFHKTIVKKKGRTKFLRFNRPFYCVIDNDDEVSCKGLLFFGATQLPVIQIPDKEVTHFETLWKMFSIEMQLNDNLQISMLQMMLKRYLILCTRLYKLQKQPNIKNKESDIVREFNFLVEKHFKTKHTVADYANLLNKSPKTISNIFSKIGSKTPIQYIQERKLLEAKRLLHYSTLQVKEIAYEIGFNGLQTFSRFFKTQEGISPSEYKETIH